MGKEFKVGVYAICKNEVKHAERWFNSFKDDIDWCGVLDTGSTDGTQELMRKLGVVVVEKAIDPWRFDVARNESMKMVPADVDVICWLDIDEVLKPGWRDALKKVYDPGMDSYQVWYTWGHGREFLYDKFHRNSTTDYEWRHPVHEVMYRKDGRGMRKVFCNGLKVDHLPDPTKSRGNYLPLLELSVKEDPSNDRNSHYYARELYFYKKYAESVEEFKRHLALPSARWSMERAASCRYVAKIMRVWGDQHGEQGWLLKALGECPTSKEAWLELAQNRYDASDHIGCFSAALNASKLNNKTGTYIEEDWAWSGPKQWDHLAVSAWYALGGMVDKKLGLEWANKALACDPGSERLKKNVEWWQSKT